MPKQDPNKKNKLKPLKHNNPYTKVYSTNDAYDLEGGEVKNWADAMYSEKSTMEFLNSIKIPEEPEFILTEEELRESEIELYGEQNPNKKNKLKPLKHNNPYDTGKPKPQSWGVFGDNLGTSMEKGSLENLEVFSEDYEPEFMLTEEELNEARIELFGQEELESEIAKKVEEQEQLQKIDTASNKEVKSVKVKEDSKAYDFIRGLNNYKWEVFSISILFIVLILYRKKLKRIKFKFK